MRTQEDFIRLDVHGHKTILLPLVSQWGELFSAYTLNQSQQPGPNRFVVGQAGDGRTEWLEIGPYMRTEFCNGQQTINGWTSTKYQRGPAVYVATLPEVAAHIAQSTIGIRDRMSWQCIMWDDTRALITCDHNIIIGGRWVAVIDPASIPAEIRKAAFND